VAEDPIHHILTQAKTVAVVGISDRPDRPSYRVAEYLQRHYRIIPINPNLETWNGLQCFPTVAAIPSSIQIDAIDVFRKSADVLPVVKEALERGIKLVWLQQGIVNEEAAALVRKASGTIVMDACWAVEHASL
jgi:predicted CoA-binding protein